MPNEDLNIRYSMLVNKPDLTAEEKLELEQLKEQLFQGSPACRDLLKQYSIEEIATLFD